MGETENISSHKSGDPADTMQNKQYGGAPILFMTERTLFGDRVPSREEWLKHEELYGAISRVIEPTHITGLQRVRGMWRIYIETLDDKVALLTQGVTLRGKSIDLLHTNPLRPDGEGTTRIRVKNIPLSVDDSVITHKFIQNGLDVITVSRERLRINGKLTNCQTGDRLVVVKSLSLKEPLPYTMAFAHFTGRVIHYGQPKSDQNRRQLDKCSKCLESGHKKSECMNDWKCLACNKTGHRKGECDISEAPELEPPRGAPLEPDVSVGTASSDTHEIATENAAKTKRSKKKRGKKAGQGVLDDYLLKTGSSVETPNKDRQKNIDALDRSPPTPAEVLNEHSKNRRVDSSESDSD